MNSIRPDGAIIWADMTKFGRVQNDDLNAVAEALRSLLQHAPKIMIGIIIAPVLTSARVAGGIRGEVRHHGGLRVSLT